MAASTYAAIGTDAAKEFLSPGRKTVVGYLLAVRGQFKRDYGLFGNIVADKIEEEHPGRVPRWPDSHSVWFGFDPDGPPRNQHQGPFLRYKRTRPIDGLRSECRGHRVELTCTIPKDGPWTNGLGAYIVRAVGKCLECE